MNGVLRLFFPVVEVAPVLLTENREEKIQRSPWRMERKAKQEAELGQLGWEGLLRPSLSLAVSGSGQTRSSGSGCPQGQSAGEGRVSLCRAHSWADSCLLMEEK